jgi:hypothetical protein
MSGNIDVILIDAPESAERNSASRGHRLIEHRLKFLALSDEKGHVPTGGVSDFSEAGE